jgi:DNA uptake protein ComE-like DNA-binding protein
MLLGLALLVAALAAMPQPEGRRHDRVQRLPTMPGCGAVYAAGRTRIDLCRADEALMESIPGIGPVLAARICAHVREKGAPKAPEDLLRVEGIGPAKLRAIRAYGFIGIP